MRKSKTQNKNESLDGLNVYCSCEFRSGSKTPMPTNWLCVFTTGLRPVNVFSLCFLQFLCIANDPWATRNNNNSQWSVDKQCLTHLWKEAIQPQTNYYKNNTTTNILLIQTDMYHRHQQAKLLIKVLAAFRLL